MIACVSTDLHDRKHQHIWTSKDMSLHYKGTKESMRERTFYFNNNNYYYKRNNKSF